MQFFYIGKSYGSKKIADKSFKAYKYKDEKTKKITLYPIIPSLYYSDKEIFIYGVGYKKIGRSVVEVPVFDGDSEYWNEYIEKYGIYCLFYSILLMVQIIRQMTVAHTTSKENLGQF